MTKEGWQLVFVMLIFALILAGLTPSHPMFPRYSVVVGTVPLPPAKPLPCLLYRGWSYPKTLEGVASWYGHREEGNRTASGEVFYRVGWTAATRCFPLGVFAKVTNLENGRWCLVWLNDRGPYINGRILDVSEAVAKHLRMHRQGLTKVQVKVVLNI